MAGVKVDQPPLSTAIVDTRTGLATREFVNFIHRLWIRTGGNDDSSDYILKLLSSNKQDGSAGREKKEEFIDLSTNNRVLQYKFNMEVNSTDSMHEPSVLISQQNIFNEDSPQPPSSFLNIPFNSPDDVKKGVIAFNNIIPSGVILMWSGSIASIPSGYFICDGTNGTPDLRDSFIVGAGSTYSVGGTGGSAQFSGSTATSSTGASVSISSSEVEPVAIPGTGVNALTSATFNDTTHSHTIIVDTIPPYYALAFIMKG